MDKIDREIYDGAKLMEICSSCSSLERKKGHWHLSSINDKYWMEKDNDEGETYICSIAINNGNGCGSFGDEKLFNIMPPPKECTRKLEHVVKCQDFNKF